MVRKLLIGGSLVLVGAFAAVEGLAPAAGTTVHASAAALKQPQARDAALGSRGLRFVYGNTAIAEPAGSVGVPVEAISVAVCPRGFHILSGGWNSADTTNDPISITSNEMGRGFNRWFVVAKDTSTDDTSTGYAFQATALCG